MFVIGSLLPPYVPKASLAHPEASVAQQQFLLVEEGFLMKSSSLTRQGARRAYARGLIHVVKEGESLERLARRYSISVDTLRWANDLGESSTLRPGAELLILPVDGVIHTVSRGQTLLRIAQLYEISAERIIEQNELDNTFILAGQELIVPGGRPIVGRPMVIASADPPPGGVTTDTPPSGVGTQPDDSPPNPVVRTSQQIVAADITNGVLQKPCSSSCFVTQYYRGGHYAVDMQQRGGGNIYASEAGIVSRSDYGWNGGYGNVIEIDHGNGLVTLYAHNKDLYVNEGDTVQRGALIASMGNTGRVYGKTGIHVHFEVRLKGIKKNPVLYIQ
jgi:LysM repeat protein